jgi:hypothetical protein
LFKFAVISLLNCTICNTSAMWLWSLSIGTNSTLRLCPREALSAYPREGGSNDYWNQKQACVAVFIVFLCKCSLLRWLQVFVRKLTVPGAHKTKALRVFKDVLKIAARGVAWQEQAAASGRGLSATDTGMGGISARSAGPASSSPSGDTARTQSASIFAHRSDLPPFATLLLGKVLARVAAALQEVPPQARLELTRAFNRADADRSGFIEEHEVKDMLCDLKGSAVSNAEASAMKALIDADGDGRISLSELIDGISKIPLTRVPLEHDTEGIVAAEFVAVVYEMAGLLPRRRTHVVNYTKLVAAGSEVAAGADTMSTMGGLRGRASNEEPDFPRSGVVRFGAVSGNGDRTPTAGSGGEGGVVHPSHHNAVLGRLRRGATEGRIEVAKVGTVDRGYATERRQGGQRGGVGFGLALRTFASELEEESHGNIVVIHSGKAPTHHYAPVSFSATAEPAVRLEIGFLAAEVPLVLRATDVDD